MATKMYQLPDIILAGSTSPKKSNPHFLNGYLGKLVTGLARFCFNKLLVL
jgi:hypothetical protein